ncbi:GNAT family N-acetyltransferase [Enterococcus ureilyticus]|uniref:GNAT family N-acetyltransferase n=1 Tax=Enterococcus ureilyticus TaxID=1131292 RepID=A0A1E5HEM4_9ENTE|nr:GNAT family N-acetyltransferase [Enterococcus ureilyticus]MBM7687342.1 ElaA protein [Enterococcus ureilyticus]OEG23402.1 GNAT family N-acetyltransferase [Enterococcus ureilyticus]
MDYHIKKLTELTTKEFLEIVKLRIVVFVVEQNCPYQEVDDADEVAWHTWLQEGTDIVGYTRIIDQGDTVTFGRVLINPKYRNQKLGNKLLKETLKVVEENYPNRPIVIGAQAHLTKFYGAFGFEAVSEVYLEDDIPHVQMRRN